MHEVSPMGHLEISTYMLLLKYSNAKGWMNPLQIRNATMLDNLGVKDLRTLQGACIKLQNAGLIRFQQKQGQGNCCYYLFDVVAQSYALDAEVNAEAVAEVNAGGNV
ncbi:MAG: hypothetical protein JWO06_3984 [Bacteroidota bacterium]|nr:hypothetical protein [Bacteroidota bacterium]